jgi:hypothetical protein
MKKIIDLLQISDFIGKSYYIDIAKGIDKIPQTTREKYEQNKRRKAWRK